MKTTMIGIKFEVEEQEETSLPIENENVGFPSDNIVWPKKKPKLENFTADSVAFDSKSIKTEPSESLSLTIELNNSLNIQNLLIQNRIQNGWTTNEQSIPIGTQQQQQSLFSTKIEPIFPENHQEISSSLNQSLSLISNSNSGETTTANQEFKDFGSISGVSSKSLTTADEMAAQSPAELTTVPLRIIGGKKPHRFVPFTLEERKARQRERNRVRRLREKANPPLMDPEVQRKKNEKRRKRREHWLATATAEQREQRRLKDLEKYRRRMENQTEEQRQRRIEWRRHYERTVKRPQKKQQRETMTPEEREQKRAIQREYRNRKKMEKKKKKKSLEESHQTSMSSTSMNLDNSESSVTSTSNQNLNLQHYCYPSTSSTTNDPLDSCEIMTEKQRRRKEYNQKYRQQLLATPEQREQLRLKNVENYTRQKEKETEEQQTLTSEEREKKRAIYRENYYKYKKRKLLMIMEKNKKNSLEESQTSMSSSMSSTSTMTNENNGIMEIGTTILKKTKKTIRKPEIMTEKQRRRSENNRKYRQQRLANATPEQREQMRLKRSESYRLQMENETEKQRKHRLELARQYGRTMTKQRKEQKQRQTMTPEEREKKRAIKGDKYCFGSETSDESNSETIITLVESPKPGPSMKKLPRAARHQKSKVKYLKKQYLESDTDTDDD